MKIAFIGQKGIPVSQGGVERHVEELSRHLAIKGHDVLAYSRTTYETGDNLLPKNVKIITLPSIPLKAWDSIIHTFLASIDVIFRKVDVIHYHHMGPAFFMFIPWVFKPKAKLIFTQHTSTEIDRPQWGFFARWAMRAGEFVGVHLADEITAVSHIMAEDLKKRYKKNVEVVPNGVSLFGKQKELNIPKKYILAVSRLIQSKGIDYLIQAFQMIKRDYPSYHLLIVGSGTKNDNDEIRLKEIAGNEPRIKFLGRRTSEELAYLYKNADIFVQPSEIEGLPITLLEAAAEGVPVICSTIPEHTSVVNDLANLFKNKNHIDLAASLRKVIDNLHFEKRRAEKLQAKVKVEFDWKHITEKMENLYEKNYLHKHLAEEIV